MINTPAILDSTQAFLAKPARMLIGGQWREASSGELLASIDPATGSVIGYVDAIVGDSIKVAAPSGQIRLIPLDWVERVGSSVYLTSDCEESHSRGVEWRNV